MIIKKIDERIVTLKLAIKFFGPYLINELWNRIRQISDMKPKILLIYLPKSQISEKFSIPNASKD